MPTKSAHEGVEYRARHVRSRIWRDGHCVAPGLHPVGRGDGAQRDIPRHALRRRNLQIGQDFARSAAFSVTPIEFIREALL
jgi:hypothetical protein